MNRRILLTVFACAMALTLVGCSGNSESTGQLHAAAPSVLGQALPDAESAITDAGFEVGSVTEQPSPNAAPETVIRQSPAPGTALARGAEIDLVVSGR